jgi:PAS domain S-box-containing protein
VGFVLRRRDVPFPSIFWLFGAFILACGTTHLMEAIIFWHPLYRLAGIIKLATAMVSWATVVALVPVIPRALVMRGPEELEREIVARKEAQRALEEANADLERRVQERTAELVKANAALQAERDRFQITLASIGDAVIVTDLTGQVTMLNRVAEALTGWPGHEAIGRPLGDVFPITNEETGQQVENPVARVLREGTVVGLANETVLTARDGTQRPIDDSIAPVKDEDGRVLGCVLVFHDVTEKRQTERELRSSRSRLSAVIDNSPAVVFVKDGEGRHLLVNRPFEQEVGRSSDQIIGQTDEMIFGAEIASRFREVDRHILATGATKVFEESFEVAGHTRTFLTSKFPLRDPGGQPVAVCGIAVNITDRKQAERDLRLSRDRLDLVVNSSGIGLWYCDLPFDKLVWNARVKEHFGLTPDAEVTIQTFYERLHPDDRERTRQAIEQAIREHSDYDIEYRTVGLDGRQRWIRAIGRTSYDESGVPIRFDGITVDNTGRKRLEEELHESEARLAAIVNHSPACIFVKDLKGRYLLANRALAQLAGRRTEEFLGCTDADFFPAEVAKQFRQDDTNVFTGGQPLVYEESFPHRGATVTYLTVKFPLVDSRGHAYAVCGIATDITANRRAERALRESEERFRLMADNIPALAWMAQPDGYIFWYNRRWYEYTGSQTKQMVGWGWQSVLDPAEVPKVMERWKASLALGEPFEMVFPLRRSDGVFRKFLTRIVPLREADGAIRYWFGTNTDITEIRAAEEGLRQRVERLRLLNESAVHLLHADNPDDMVRGLFQQVNAHLGVDTYFNFMLDESGDALHLESCAGISDEEARKIARLEFGQSICGTVALERQPIVATNIQQSDDAKAQLVKSFGVASYACSPLLSGDRLLGTLSFASHTRNRFKDDELEFIRTLSHYVTLAFDRLRLVKELRDADRRKDEFLAMLAHELRNPLAPIRNALQILRMRNTDGVTAARIREMMERQLQHLVRLVDDLLDVSRIMRNKIELRKEVVDLRQVVERAEEIARPVIDAQGHELSVSLPPEPLFVEGDSVRLAQAASNLLSNAAKFTERSGRVWLTLEREGSEAVLRVRDNGVGIPPELLRRVFDLFEQGDRSVARTQGGLGIGLTLVKRLVEMHGGSVAAFSEGQSKGSEFIVRLPITLPPGIGRGDAPAGDTKVQSRRRRVLVVDDNVDAAESLTIVLRLLGHDVRAAPDGPSGLEVVRTYQPELVLLDIGLPGMDGYEVARRMRLMPEGRSVRLVAVTGYGQEEDRRRAHDAGFDCHLTKPVNPQALEQLLEVSSR